MTDNKHSSNGKRPTQPKRQGARGKRIRVEPTRRERPDPDVIALCYWLITQRIAQEAGDEDDAANRPGVPTPTNGAHS